MKNKKKGLFARLFEGLDKKMQEKAAQSSCGCCCSGDTASTKKHGKGNDRCCK